MLSFTVPKCPWELPTCVTWLVPVVAGWLLWILFSWELEFGEWEKQEVGGGARLRGAHTRQSVPRGEAAGLFLAFGVHLIHLSFHLGTPSHLSRKLSVLLYAGWSPFLLPAMKSPTWDMWSHLFLLEWLLPRHPHPQCEVQGLQENPGPSPLSTPSRPCAPRTSSWPPCPPGMSTLPRPLSLWGRLTARHR